MHIISISHWYSTEEGKNGDDKNHMPKNLTEKLLIGTTVLVFALDTIVIISSFETNTKTPNVLISIFIFICLSILRLATFPISGGYLNPAITFFAALLGVISFTRATIYIVARGDSKGGHVGSHAP
ncbi:hypothetical protein MKW94_023310 [Papaver nudicaule]|uniref:Uncharacterized protein n=1 Tax=Papaver nudicaule TaxID=74823 RepID=A0AA41S3U0_PAPNU|nr:hypothetical protein [Papaver nudicaule]